MSLGRAGTAVAGATEITHGLTKSVHPGARRDAFVEMVGGGGNIENGPVIPRLHRRVRIAADEREAPRAGRRIRPGQRRRDVVALAGVAIGNSLFLAECRTLQRECHRTYPLLHDVPTSKA